MFEQDIAGSMAHAQMLGAQGIIEKADADRICDGLAGILDDLKSGALPFDPNAEDIHMFVEQVLTERIGDTGKRLHTARSRNDQVALDIRLYLRDEMKTVSSLLFIITIDSALQSSMQKSRSETPSSEFAVTPEKPSFRAASCSAFRPLHRCCIP